MRFCANPNENSEEKKTADEITGSQKTKKKSNIHEWKKQRNTQMLSTCNSNHE